LQFLRSQAQAILARDLFTVDLLNGTQAHVLAVIEHATRRIRILGVTLHPDGSTSRQERPGLDHRREQRLWGSRTRHRRWPGLLCGSLVFVEEAA
jgi:hypothetical protein